MKISLFASVAAVCAGVATTHAAPAASPSTERIVVVRHGEKPAAGLGQLACKGLERALALPDVLLMRFGPPQSIYAPNPARKKADAGHLYNYIRPLATIEPLAIMVGLPVNVDYGFDQTAPLARSLVAPSHSGQTIVVAWEHHLAVALEREIVRLAGGDPKSIAGWKDDDFDRLDVIEIERSAGSKAVVRHTQDRQGLDGVADTCPAAPTH